MQVEIVEGHLEKKRNILLHSPGGCGKSHTIREVARRLTERKIVVFCTATTGIAALNLAAPGIRTRTLHSWAGVGLARDTAQKLAASVLGNSAAKKRWRSTSVLIVDEVSMLGESLLTKLDKVGRIVRGVDAPFGGLQVIFSADFLQLPPVKDDWAFKAPVWAEMNFVVVPFTQPMRYTDIAWFQLLLRVRKGVHSAEDIATLETRVLAYDEYKELEGAGETVFVVKPTILYSTKRDVYSYNMTELGKLEDSAITYLAKDAFKKLDRGVMQEVYEEMLNDAIPASIVLKPGAQVMLKANIDVDRGLVNGSRGVITRCEADAVYILFHLKTSPIRIAYHTWSIEDDRMVASRSQIPLILAWASTIHKLQGCTLDFAICDLGSSIFEDGQAYVALSRVRSLEGLYLSNLHPRRIKTNAEALSFVSSLNVGVVKTGIVVVSSGVDADMPDHGLDLLIARIARSPIITSDTCLVFDITSPTARAIGLGLFLEGNVMGVNILFPCPWTDGVFSNVEFDTGISFEMRAKIILAINRGAAVMVIPEVEERNAFIKKSNRLAVCDWGEEPGREASGVLSTFEGTKKYIDLCQ
jgi:ATP-dependent DNA helicase PIF1